MNFNIFFVIVIVIIILVAIVLFIFRKRNVAKTLIIVGNGFDLYHGIPSSYLSFKEYVKNSDGNVYDALEKYLSLENDTEWNQLEKNLSNLDADELLEEMRIHLGDQSGDWKDSMYFEYQYEVGKVTEKLGRDMQKLFLSWILNLDIRHQSNSPRLFLPEESVYLNFNYTNSLEKLYKIKQASILYIHGKAIDTTSSIVLGHGWHEYQKATIAEAPTYEEFVDGDYSTEEDWQYKEAKSLIDEYFRNSYKNASEIIAANESFFKSLRGVKNIYVMGHSMADVDRVYFKQIAEAIRVKNVSWTISYYKKEDVERCTQTLKQIGVDMQLVEFKHLQDFFSPQMKLF